MLVHFGGPGFTFLPCFPSLWRSQHRASVVSSPSTSALPRRLPQNFNELLYVKPESTGPLASVASEPEGQEEGKEWENLEASSRSGSGSGSGGDARGDEEGEGGWEMVADAEVPETCCGYARLGQGQGWVRFMSCCGCGCRCCCFVRCWFFVHQPSDKLWWSCFFCATWDIVACAGAADFSFLGSIQPRSIGCCLPRACDVDG